MNFKNYPMVKLNGRNFLLSIYPSWHTRLFPESILNNEDPSTIRDVPYTNSIFKVFLSGIKGLENLKCGDNLLIYRTSDGQGPALYRSVATSVCVVQEVKHISEFSSYLDFKNYCAPHSVFEEYELQMLYKKRNYPSVLKFTYNFPLEKRVIRKELIEITGYGNDDYWGFLKLSDDHFKQILLAGNVYESLIVD
ncbi:hypothetical protein [Pantoea agglomerans]|uniref:hypothetical protein n=1 Tax=Enterobacter agglomerans TaxID=549 RepID=UPI00078685AE|nr:hypothetical protein [Pantoea agglomerans]QXB59578.1 hypothetical protein I6L77_05470 [Pantoea agglomerans]